MKKINLINLTFFIAIFFCIEIHTSDDYQEIKCELKRFKRPAVTRNFTDEDNDVIYPSYPNIPIKFGRSTNWSGYAALTSFVRPRVGSVDAVYGSWIVPNLKKITQHRYCAIWVGIDGYANGTVEQIGTESDVVNGRQINYAWFEMFPRDAFLINNFPVSVNDVISASVVYLGNNVFRLKIINHTKKISTTIPTSFTTMNALRTSAEWIVEAPALNNKILPLANFGIARLFNCQATINHVLGPIDRTPRAVDRIVMVTANNVTRAAPSKLLNGGKNFNVAWRHP